MNAGSFEHIGFRRPVRHARPLTPRKIAFAELIMTVALVLSIAVAATAVSIGIACADEASGAVSHENSFALATFVGAMLALLGASTAAVTRRNAGPHAGD
jgi:hypothetical protein